MTGTGLHRFSRPLSWMPSSTYWAASAASTMPDIRVMTFTPVTPNHLTIQTGRVGSLSAYAGKQVGWAACLPTRANSDTGRQAPVLHPLFDQADDGFGDDLE